MKEKNEKKKEKKRGLRKKLIAIIILMFMIITIAVEGIVSWIFVKWTKLHYAENAMANAKTVSSFINGEQVLGYLESGEKDLYYNAMLDMLNDIRINSKLKYLYVCVPEEEGYRYIWDAGDPDSEEGVRDLGDFDEYYGGGAEFMLGVFQAAKNHQEEEMVTEDSVLVTKHPEYGEVASAFAPIYNAQGEAVALSAVDISIESIHGEIFALIMITGFFMIIAMVVFCFIFYGQMERRLVNPINNLNDVIRHFVSEQMKEGKVLECDISTGDEIEELADSFSKMSVELKDYMENFTTVTKEKERIGAELNVAQKIQEDMLPRIFPPYPERKDFDVYASMDPAKEVGGDFYDLFLVDENHIALTVADVSGKGVPAALFMVITKTLLKNRTMMGGAPSQIVADVNNQLCEGNEAEYFVTLWFAIVDLTTGDGIAVNAGHEHPILKKKDGDYVLIKYRHSPPIGTMPDFSFEQRRFRMEPGDLLFVYTDGVPEAMNANEELYGTDRLIEVLNQNKDAGPEELLPSVKDDIDAYVGAAPQFDDLTMLAFRLNGT
ncbi:MAG: SpoIIE family protein phosphatase [Lachnospiraceae bacterium]|nr:SpoIIE family protein phosphatase [Lachnospiraceae bacterium]